MESQNFPRSNFIRFVISYDVNLLDNSMGHIFIKW